MTNYIKAFALTNLGIPDFKVFKRGKKLEQELIKYTNIDSVKVIDLPEEVYESVDKTKILDNPAYKDRISAFGSKIIEMVPEEDLGNFYRNFSSIQFLKLTASQIYRGFVERRAAVGGQYDPKTNRISFKETILSSAIGALTHELLHAASSYYDKKRKIVYCGLSQIYINEEDSKKSETYGLALNEGYTQYLNNKYFVDQNSVTLNIMGKSYTAQAKNDFAEKVAYKEEQIIAKALNAIVGEDKMQKFYFRGNLKGLVEELEQYQPKEAIYRFINYTDTLCYYSARKNVDNETIDEVKRFVNSFLLSTFMKAQKAKKIDDNEQYAYFLENCLPYEHAKTHNKSVDKEYLTGEVINPLEKVSRKK